MSLRTEDLDKAIVEVIGTFDGVEEISAGLREGIVNYIPRKDILAVLLWNSLSSPIWASEADLARTRREGPRKGELATLSHKFSFVPRLDEGKYHSLKNDVPEIKAD